MLNTSLPECVCNEQLLLNGDNDIYENKNILDEWITEIDAFIHNN